MSDVVIHAENLGKKYTIGHQIQRERYTALRDVLVRNARTLWHKTRDLAQGKPIIPGDTTEDVWALRDVNFEIKRGEAVGIIGRNGAGKSTLLKVLSRITEPSAGRVTIKGRVASLLEVGTGFHPELTGRENIYLNGAILGMTRAEIKRKFDEIVDFAEVEKFLDTPVKRYSSGMYVRLAFAVAAHLEPEILVVDEVLAVGDAAFQKKCLGKMGDVAGEGRTVLFVSHNMAAIQALCTRCFVLAGGRTEFVGLSDLAVRYYIQSTTTSSYSVDNGDYDLSQRTNPYSTGHIFLRRIRLVDPEGSVTDSVLMGDPLLIELETEETSTITNYQVGVIFKSPSDQWLANINTGMAPPESTTTDSARKVFTLSIPSLPFVPGEYWLDVSASQKTSGRIDYVERAAKLTVVDNDYYGSGYGVKSSDGIVFLNASWKNRNA